MSTLVYKGRGIPAQSGETVLDCLLRSDVPIASSCRSGICQSCLVQGKSVPPAKSQKGLSRSLVEDHFFLACQCSVEDSPELVDEVELPVFSSRIRRIEKKADGIYQVFIEKPTGFAPVGGQFVQVSAPSLEVMRSYSVANIQDEDDIELHVERLPQGRMSGYLTSEEGASLSLRGPAGECRYSGNTEEHLVLVGTGTGLAPLVGVVREALFAGHTGPIDLFHGASRADRLYLSDELKKLAGAHGNFTYFEDMLSTTEPTLEGGPSIVGLPTLLKERYPRTEGLRFYLCGNPELVGQLKKQSFLLGASLSMIHSDPFVLAPSA